MELLKQVLLESDEKPEGFETVPASMKLRKAFDRLDNDDYVVAKPVDWDRFHKAIEPHELVLDYGIDLDRVQRFGARELWNKGRPKPYEYFRKRKVPQIFVVNIPGKGAFLVDTEGNAYVRYAAKIDI